MDWQPSKKLLQGLWTHRAEERLDAREVSRENHAGAGVDQKRI